MLEISDICKNAGVFIIDDLAYSGLEFDRKNLALPICSLDGHFDNTITLYTLSKSYGLAAFRSGMIIANEIVISLIRDRIFQVSDSLSILQQAPISTIFKADIESQNKIQKYFSFITNEYYERYIFAKTILLGLNTVDDNEKNIFTKLIQDKKLSIDEKDLSGIVDLEIVIRPSSGFFLLLDLTKFIDKSHKNFTISDDRSLLQFLYTFGNIKTLTGDAFCWPNHNELIVRVTFAFSYEDLLDGYLRLKKTLDLLK